MITYDELINFWEEKEPDCIEWFEQLCSVQREVVPFVGAGISKNINGKAYPLWKEFLEEIGKRELLTKEAEKLDHFVSANCYEQAAGFLQERLGDVLFRDNIKKIFGEERLKDVVFPETIRLIIELFHGNIITTNIDRVIETAFEELKHIKIPALIPQMQSDQTNQNIDANTLCLIKLHGDVRESTSWVLTEEQYNLVYGENIESTSLFVSILERLMISRKLLFIGCGLERDRTYDVLNRIIQKNSTYKHFAFIECPEKRDAQILKKRQLINSWNIYPIWFPETRYESIGVLMRQMTLHQARNTFDTDLKKKVTLFCKGTFCFIDRAFLKEYSQPDEKLSRIFLLVSGELDAIAHAVCCEETLCNQDAFDAARAYIEKDSTMPLFITGAGGQGKTVLMMELAKYFCEKDYPVFWIPIGRSSPSRRYIQEFVELLDEVSAVYGKKVLLMLDNPYADLDHVEKIYQAVNYEVHPVQVIVTERTNRLDYLFADDKYRFAMWSAEAHFLCLGKPCEFKPFDWIQQSSTVPFHSRWRYEIIKNIFSKLEADQKVETSVVEHILKKQEKVFNNSSISLVETVYQFIFEYNERAEHLGDIRILSKRLPLDWDEWEDWLSARKIDGTASYAYMAALYLLKISVSVETLSRILNIPEYRLEFELDNSLRNGYREPVVYDSVNKTVSIKHDMIAELYFKLHAKISVQNIYKGLLRLMNEKELLKFSKKLFIKKVIFGKIKSVFDVNIDQLISEYVKNQNILKTLEANGKLPWFELVRVWNKQVNPESKDQPCSFDDLSERYKEDKKVLLETAMYYKDLGNKPEKVEKILITLLETDYANLPALNELARFYADRGRDKEAEETFRRALKVDSGHLPALNELARFYADHGRDKEAEETFQHALEVDSRHLPVLNELARFYADRGRDEEAEKTFRRALKVYSGHLPALNELARLYADRGRDKEAEETFLRALKVDSSNLPVLNELARFYADRGKDKEAEETFRRALEVDSSNLPVLNELARFYADRGKDEKAEETFLRALEVDSSDLPALNELARFYADHGRDKEAEETFQRALKVDSSNLPVLNELARFYADRGRDEKAEETFLRALKVDSTNLPVLNELARFYADRGKYEKAEENLLLALEVEENNLPVLNELGRLYKKEKKNESALKIFEKIVSIADDDIIALYEAARLNKRMKNIDVAIQYYNKILEKSANDSKAIVGLFYCYYDDDRDLQKAGGILKKYSRIQNEEYYLRCCAKLCIKLKRREDIKQIKERLVKIGSNYVI